MVQRVIIFSCAVLWLAGCSTPRKSRLAATAGAFVVGAGIGQSTAPADERAELHAVYWGSLAALATLIASDFYFSEEREMQLMSLENQRLKSEIELFQNANTVLLKEGKGYFKNSSGEEFFQSGRAKWRLYQVDKWQKESPTRLYHQDRMVELLPVEGEGK